MNEQLMSVRRRGTGRPFPAMPYAEMVSRIIVGETRLHSKGYRLIYCPPHPSARRGWVYEHRLVMERTLGRLLASHEHVHHVNGDALDNRPENLELVDGSTHRIRHFGTPTDAEVAGLIRGGWTSREIMQLGVSTHRIVRVRREMAA